MLKNIARVLIILIFFVNNLFAEEIPIIVISPGKTVQSLSTVGSSVEVFNSETINNSSHFSLADVIDDNSTSTNLLKWEGTVQI